MGWGSDGTEEDVGGGGGLQEDDEDEEDEDEEEEEDDDELNSAAGLWLLFVESNPEDVESSSFILHFVKRLKSIWLQTTGLNAETFDCDAAVIGAPIDDCWWWKKCCW